MACRGFWECLLKLLNFLMTLAGLAMVGYGIYLFVMYKQASSSHSDSPTIAPVSADESFIKLGRPLILSVSLSNNIFDNLPKPWFLYLFIGVGVVLFVISCCGCIGATTRNGCCLTTYAIFIVLLILLELGCAALIFFDKSWLDKIPKDKTGYFDMIYDFLEEHWTIAKWVFLGIVVLEVSAANVESLALQMKHWRFFIEMLLKMGWDGLRVQMAVEPLQYGVWADDNLFTAVLFLLTVIVRAANGPADYDSDDEFINPRQSVKQPLISRQPPPTSVPAAGALDQRSSRNDAWSARMREKYGLDTSEFTYNPNDSSRYQQPTAQPTEEGGRCTIM